MYKLIIFPLIALLASCAFVTRSPQTKLVDKTSASIVRISGTMMMRGFFGDEQPGTFTCSGFVIGQNEVLTAGHCDGQDMTADGVAATKVKVDKFYDLMVLKVETKKTPLVFSEEPVVRFQHLTGIGYAFGWTKLTAIEVKPILIDYSPEDDLAPGMFVQNSYIGGMSGGPVVDDYGQVVGIVQRTNEGVGYGVTVQLIKAFLVGVEN